MNLTHRKLTYCFILFLALLLASNAVISPAFSSPATTQATVSTGNVSVGGVLTLRLDYSISVDLSGPSTATPGQTMQWTSSVSGGTATVTVSVAGQTFSHSFSLPLGQRVPVQVATGLELDFFATAKSSLTVSGPASAGDSSFSWDSQNSRNSFTLNVQGGASPGSAITINLPTSVVLNVAATINLLILKQQIATTSLGPPFPASPTPTAGIQVVSPQSPLGLQFQIPSFSFGVNPLALASPIVVGLAAADFFARKKTPRENLIQANVAVVFGLVLLNSLLSDWVLAGGSPIPGPAVGSIFSQIPLIGTLFDFMFVFSALVIIGGFVHLGNYTVGRRLVNTFANLCILFSVIFILVFSTLPGTQPSWVAWLSVISSIIARLSTSLRRH